MPRKNLEIDRDFYKEFKKVRNLFRKFDPISVVSQILNFIHSKRTNQAAAHQPWMLLLLLKWVFQDDHFFNRGRSEIDTRNLNKLINLTYMAGDVGRGPNETGGFDVFFRRAAYQQFIYQNQVDGVLSSFALDIELFGSSANKAFSDKFHETFKVNVEDFLLLAFAVITASLMPSERRNVYDISFFKEISEAFEDDVPENFLNAISMRIGDIPNSLKRPPSYRMSADEIYETSPFFDFPLIKYGQQYFVTHPEVVVRGLKDFLHRNLNKLMNDQQKRRFSSLFEKQVGKRLEYLSYKVKSEDILKSEFGDQCKVTDFFIEDQSYPVFIEAKATELSKNGRLAVSSQQLKDRLKNILYAIKQAEGVMLKLKRSKADSFDSQISYLIIVTYGQYFIGDGHHLTTLLENTSYEFPKLIPLQNVFVLNFSEFEHLTEISKTKNYSIGEILTIVSERASRPEQRRFVFQNYLDELFQGVEIPRNSDDPFTQLLENTLSTFRN